MGLSHRQSKNNDYRFCLVLYDGLLTLDFTLVIRPVHSAGAGELGLCGEPPRHCPLCRGGKARACGWQSHAKQRMILVVVVLKLEENAIVPEGNAY